MDYFLTLIIGGLLSGAVYALVGMAFVVVYRASSVLNFSLGEWVSLGARLTGIGVQVGGLPILAAVAGALGALSLLAIAFNRIVIRRLIGRPVTAIVMATLALGILMRAVSSLSLGGLPNEIPFPMTGEVWWWGEIPIPPARLMASGIAILLVFAVIAFFRFSRAGVAIRAIADDPQAATGVGISVTRYLAMAWGISAGLAVAGGVLWSIDGLGGFGMALILAKVLPVVVIGGLTSFPGAIIGAALVGVLENLAAGYLDPIIGTGSGGLISGILVIGVLWIRPTGILGARQAVRV